MAAVESVVFVCGGKSHQCVSRCLSSVESYDPRVDQWSFVTPMRYDCCYMATVGKSRLRVQTHEYLV